MNVWTLLIPAALFFFGAGMLFPLATSGAMEPFPFWLVPPGRWWGVTKYWFRRAGVAFRDAASDRTGQPGSADDPYGCVDSDLLVAAGVTRVSSGAGGLSV